MKTISFFRFIAAVSVLVLMASCGSNKNNESEQTDDYCFDNPIDSIVVHNADVSNLFDEVYGYLDSHPDFPSNSDSVGYHYYACNDLDGALLWKECGNVRVYSIPWESIHSALGYNIVQIKDKDGSYRLDTTFLNGDAGRMDNLFKITNQMGKTFYLLKTSAFTLHQGATRMECISAFSVENGKLAKENLFHTKSWQYDRIEVECGGQRELPLDYSDIVLICMDNFEEDNGATPLVVIAEINENDWPTGYGLKYRWNGDWFEYAGKCRYDADEIIR
ncbi:MAG: hypothetical protein J6T88_10225 [Bacteroidales bacterium]|nr:hypothetical protein [Bacteroidales bacterium]